MSHTPPPWYAIQGNAPGFWVISQDEVTQAIICFVTLRSDEENAANARIIAAAPSVLEHLEFAVKLLLPLFGRTAQIEAMQSAIATARGIQ